MSDQLRGKKIAILVANEGVEQVELTSPRDALYEAGAEVDLLAPEEGETPTRSSSSAPSSRRASRSGRSATGHGR